MPASGTRIAVAAAVVVLLAIAGGFGLQTMRTPSSKVGISVPVTNAKPQPPVGPSQADASAASPPVSREKSGDSGSATPPSFDVARVEPSGEALLAGRGKPDATVSLVDRGKVVAEAKADAGGNFVILPPTLKPGDHALSLRQGQDAAAVESKQSVVVSVPASKKDQVVVTLSEPGKATTLLSAPPEPSKAGTASVGATSAAELAIRSVELENGSGLFASGTAPPGTNVRLYLNDSRVADVVAAALGEWSVRVRKGLAAGRYAVRVDALKSDQSVTARAEVPFDVPAPMSAAAEIKADDLATIPPAKQSVPPAESPSKASRVVETGGHKDADVVSRGASSSAHAVVDELQTELVTRGANLWRISRHRLGQGIRYTQIYAANAAQIRDPKLIYPGQVFVLPR